MTFSSKVILTTSDMTLSATLLFLRIPKHSLGPDLQIVDHQNLLNIHLSGAIRLRAVETKSKKVCSLPF